MVYQLFNLSDKKVFDDFSNSYKIFREMFDGGLYALEIRNVSVSVADEIYKIILDEKEICYRRYPDSKSADILIPGSLNQLRNLSRKVIASGKEDIGYRLQNMVLNYERYNQTKYTIGDREFFFERPYVMGILNVTPDSFSDGGKYYNTDEAVKFALGMLDEGADIIDVGGESTRPGSDPVDEGEEKKRVIPVIKAILEKRPGTIISVDTTKSGVAAEALESGALLVNDISGLTFDSDMAFTAAKYKAGVIIMHIKGIPKNMQQQPVYENVVKEVFNFLSEQSSYAAKAGIKNIFIDPGIGFGKTPEHNFELIKRLDDFKCLGYPILAGVSRKSFIGKLLNLDVSDRDSATAITETGAVLKGARLLRTHNASYGRYVVKLTEKLI